MMGYSHGQAIHDEVNLLRLIRRLEKSVSSEQDWNEAPTTQQEHVWLKALGTLQKVKHGRKLLHRLEQYDTGSSPTKIQQRGDVKEKLDRVELFVTEVHKKTELIRRQPEPFLPRIPVPAHSAHTEISSPLDVDREISERQNQIEGGAHPTLNNVAKDDATLEDLSDGGFLAARDASAHPSAALPSPALSLLPATPNPAQQPRSSLAATSAIDSSSTNTLSARKHLQASSALHEELSVQLAQMAAQLKRNAHHFSDSLAKDKAVVEETQDKLEGNFGVMLKERIRLRDFRGKSGSTTWLTIGIVVAVLILFVFMVAIIRLTGR